jgi:hypothetical protein
MPVAFEGPRDELSGPTMFLEEQRAALLRNFDGRTDAEATSRPTPSSFCMLTSVKHVATVERRWFQLEIARRQIEGLGPPPDEPEMEVEAGDSVEPVRGFYEQIIEEIARHAGHVDLIRESIDGSTGP